MATDGLFSGMAADRFREQWKPGPRETVVFVHGAVVNGWEMLPLRRRLRRLGYQVRQFCYDSMRLGLDENVGHLRKFVADTEGDKLHLIGHSMGGILIRHVFEKSPDPRPGRLIAVGSPFTDCWIGRRLAGINARWGARAMGRTVHDHISREREPLWRGGRDFGVLAGTYPFGIGRVFHDLPAPSDGVVLWEETRLPGVSDHVTFRLNHFGMLLSQRCCSQMARFLAWGRFGSE